MSSRYIGDTDDALLVIDLAETADDVLYFFQHEDFLPWKSDAAKKLIAMWKDGRWGGITLEHLASIAADADEPEKSEANQIIKDNP